MLPTMRTLLFTLFVYASVTNAAFIGVRSGSEDSTRVEGVDNVADWDQDRSTFSRLLSAVSPRALQQLVHDHDAEDVYVRSPVVATIVRLAVRQATSGNDTSTSDTPTSTSSDVPTSTSSTSNTPSPTSTEEPPTSTEEPPTSTETPSTSTTSMTETSSDTPTTSSSATPTPTPAPTTEPSSTETPSETPAPTSSSSSTPTSESSSETDLSTTSSPISAHTTPKPTSKTSTFTSTLPGGAVTTVTEVAVVTPGATEGDDDGTPTGGNGSLQTDSAAAAMRGPVFGVIAGLLVGGVMLA